MKKKSRIIYSEEFKWRVVQDVLSGKFTKEEARRIYGIRSNCAILYWMRKFSGNDSYRDAGSYLINSTEMAQNKEEQALRQEIKLLKEELQREKLRADIWQKIIEVAEDKLGIEIRKKFGAKQSTFSKKNKEK